MISAGSMRITRGHIMDVAAQALGKRVENFGMPWESAYGYSQAVQVGNVIYVSGQLSHDDEGNLVGPAPVESAGKVLDGANMELQMRTTYANTARLLERFGATLENVVEEALYVVDFDAAFAVAGKSQGGVRYRPPPLREHDRRNDTPRFSRPARRDQLHSRFADAVGPRGAQTDPPSTARCMTSCGCHDAARRRRAPLARSRTTLRLSGSMAVL